ncbi:hypothetical protein HanRHA438_Chr13g0608231 [Helianthus annuus]|nr:hypothetical protein HanRHA438_Chr13g0608231 [Helianthus annuus]
MDRAAVLSHFNSTGNSILTCNSCNTFTSHITSHKAAHIDLYSASAEDLDTTLCFLLFQEIKDFPRNIQNPVIDLLLSIHFAQSESA